jgi:hypothetical protein
VGIRPNRLLRWKAAPIEGFEAANEFLGQQEHAAAAAGYRFDYQEGKMVMVRIGNKP